MPLQNRVQPDGQIIAHPARGQLMGNRGILHDEARRLGPARWRHRGWVCCVLAFKGRHRVPMSGRTWTELFFADEAVALAAGHRPCAECRRADYNAYRAAWARATGTPPSAPQMDAALHAARAKPGGRRLKTWTAESAALPDGTFIATATGPALLLGTRALSFAPEGYGPPGPRPSGPVTVFTPAPSVAVLAAGYRPLLHQTASHPRYC